MNHISSAIDKLLADQIARHSDIIRMGEQIRREREQESREREAGNSLPSDQ